MRSEEYRALIGAVSDRDSVASIVVLRSNGDNLIYGWLTASDVAVMFQSFSEDIHSMRVYPRINSSFEHGEEVECRIAFPGTVAYGVFTVSTDGDRLSFKLSGGAIVEPTNNERMRNDG